MLPKNSGSQHDSLMLSNSLQHFAYVSDWFHGSQHEHIFSETSHNMKIKAHRDLLGYCNPRILVPQMNRWNKSGFCLGDILVIRGNWDLRQDIKDTWWLMHIYMIIYVTYIHYHFCIWIILNSYSMLQWNTAYFFKCLGPGDLSAIFAPWSCLF